MEKILITGATGHLGLQVCKLLSRKIGTENFTILVRNNEKAASLTADGIETRIGDYDDYQSLVKAFSGIKKLFFISASDITKRVPQHENVVNAAKESGVKHVVYSSFQRKNETSSSPIAMVSEAHIKTEKWIKEAGMKYTILKNTLYMDMLPVFMGDKVIENGMIYLPAGEGQIAYLTREDMAKIAANILTEKGHENMEYEISGTHAFSYQEIADLLSNITGKTISYVSPTVEEFSKTLSGAGVPAEYVGLFASFSEAAKQGEFSTTNPKIAQLIGSEPVSMQVFLEKVYRK